MESTDIKILRSKIHIDLDCSVADNMRLKIHIVMHNKTKTFYWEKTFYDALVNPKDNQYSINLFNFVRKSDDNFNKDECYNYMFGGLSWVEKKLMQINKRALYNEFLKKKGFFKYETL